MVSKARHLLVNANHPEQSPQWCVMDINVTQCRADKAENHEIQTINAGLALVNVTDRSLYTPQ